MPWRRRCHPEAGFAGEEGPTGVAVGGNAPSTTKEQALRGLFDIADQHGAVEVLTIKIPENAGVEAAVLLFCFPDNFQGFLFRCPADGSGRQQGIKHIAQLGGVIIGQLSGNFGAYLEQIFSVGADMADIPEAVDAHRFGHPAEVIAQQIHGSDVLGVLFIIVQNQVVGIRNIGVDGTLHRVGGHHTVVDTHERFGREHDEFAGYEQFISGMAVAVGLLERNVSQYPRRKGQVDQVGIPRQQVFMHPMKSLLIGFKGHRLNLPGRQAKAR